MMSRIDHPSEDLAGPDKIGGCSSDIEHAGPTPEIIRKSRLGGNEILNTRFTDCYPFHS